jgi:hypothetical protein
MNIKIGKIELCDWQKYSYGPGALNSRRIIKLLNRFSKGNSKGIYGAVDLAVIENFPDVWNIKFYYDLAFLNNIHAHSQFTGTEEQVKEYTDNFLIRISKLLVFS